MVHHDQHQTNGLNFHAGILIRAYDFILFYFICLSDTHILHALNTRLGKPMDLYENYVWISETYVRTQHGTREEERSLPNSP